jgi:hypothetical protein
MILWPVRGFHMDDRHGVAAQRISLIYCPLVVTPAACVVTLSLIYFGRRLRLVIVESNLRINLRLGG